jgi:hypothetical protein
MTHVAVILDSSNNPIGKFGGGAIQPMPINQQIAGATAMARSVAALLLGGEGVRVRWVDASTVLAVPLVSSPLRSATNGYVLNLDTKMAAPLIVQDMCLLPLLCAGVPLSLAIADNQQINRFASLWGAWSSARLGFSARIPADFGALPL